MEIHYGIIKKKITILEEEKKIGILLLLLK